MLKTKSMAIRVSTLLAALFLPLAMWAQVTVTGMVTDQTGEPVIGATVMEKGTQNGTVTD